MALADRFRDDLEAFVLGALEPDEAGRVEAHIATCDECAQLVHSYRLAVENLALSVTPFRASPRLKQRIMGGIGAVRPFGLPRLFVTRWAASAAAAVLLAFAIGGAAWAIILSSQVEQLKRDNVALAELTELDAEQRSALLRLQGDLYSARNEQRRMSTTLDEQATLLVLALDPDLSPTELEGTRLASTAACSYVWSTKQSVGALTCRDLPTTAFSLTYELWVLKGGELLALGTFLPRDDGTAAMLVKFPEETAGPVDNLWVTLETFGVDRSEPSAEIVLKRAPANQAAR